MQEICGGLGIPPVLHMGRCVDNARILQLAAMLANAIGVSISDLPLATSSPEWYSEKAATMVLSDIEKAEIQEQRSSTECPPKGRAQV